MIRCLRSNRNFLFIWLLALLPGLGYSAALNIAEVAPPEFDPANVDSGWTGSTLCKIKDFGILQGRWMYTLDGTPPANTIKGSTKQYTAAGIEINQTCWVTMIHIQNGDPSQPATAHFQRARTPTPVPAYGGNPKFYPALQCTLNIAPTHSTATIRLTRDGSSPTAASPAYTGPFTISKSEVLTAYAIAEGYDMSDMVSVAFTYLDPPPAPTVVPGSQKFSTGTQSLKVTCPVVATSCRYSDKPGVIDLASAGTLLTTDTVSIHGGKDGDTVYFRVQAFRMGYPPSPVTTTKYAYLPTVAAPTIFPAPTAFYDTITVKMSSTTQDAMIRYVDDNTTPTLASKDGGKAFRLEKGVTLRAMAFKGAQPSSPISSFSYNLRLTPPIPDRPSQEYVDSLKIRFAAKNPNATIFYTLSLPAPVMVNGKPTGIQYDTAKGVTISAVDTTIVSTIAVLEGIASAASTNTYVKKAKITTLTEPSLDPPGVEFVDTLSVYLSTEDANSEIHYTLSTAGQVPTRLSPIAHKGVPIRLDSTVQLFSRAFPINGSKLDSSTVRKDKYTVLPSQPVATPMPVAPFANNVTVTLRSRTKKGVIHYTVNDASRILTTTQGFPDSVKVTLNSTSTIRAITVVDAPPNDHNSSQLSLTYEIYTSIASDTLAKDATRTLTGGYSFINNSAGPIIARAHTTESLGLQGFNNQSLAILLQPAQPGAAFQVTFAKPADSPVALYRVVNGKIEFVTSENRMELTQPGDYFLGVDMVPPVITLIKQVPAPGDSTTVRLQVTDNVAYPACEITSAGIPGGKTTRVPDAEGIINVNLKAAAGNPKGLWMRASAQDRFNTGTLPTDPAAKLYLAQVWSKLTTPSVLVIGQGTDLWDMAGFPVSGSAPLKWSQIRAANPGIQACAWMDDKGYYYLEDTAEVGPGRAIWVGSRSAVSGLSVGQFRAGESEPDGTWRIRIHPGWNQVTSPSLDKVYWPITVAKSKQVGGSFLKAPYKYTRNENDPWLQVDSLEPWVGYFVLYYGTRDTVITIYSDLAKRPVSKVSAEDGHTGSLDLSIDPGLGMPLRLGARTWATDGFGIEDEPNLPALRPAFSAWALRGRRNLMTDVVRFTPGEVMHWNVVLDPGAMSAVPALSGKISGTLPQGYEAWAVSRLRGLKFRLDPGQPLPAPESLDTLSVYAGPAEKLSAVGELARASAHVERFDFSVEKGRDASWLRLELPWAAQVDASIWSLDGRRLASINPGSLNSGLYRLRLDRGADAQPALLRLRVRSADGLKEHSRRVIW